MTNFQKSFHIQLYLFLFSIFVLVAALGTQYFFKLYPCTYCIIARYIITITATLSLSSYLLSLFIDKKRPFLKERHISLFEKISALLMALIPLNLIAGGIFAYHHYIVVFKQDFTCGVDELQEYLNNMLFAKIIPPLYEATGNCVDANYKLFDLVDYVHLPVFVYIISLIFVIYYFKYFFQRNKTLYS